ncbi:MAG: 16S rRNA (adenine(1518)-N(6)/adenine(1519)-N(6))-dimethyltransferase RsmA [Reichenbachiella sp.]|uniref:16S rRNA (adenine(1518)-N(6)/adenine(1519)-N(6))- dimethyltransferase RsmA n=1 Tax=Reichenbachiella sp. TaxID=2184521 RepID=UPI0029669314|nr:16S rRNA (adenine(1518)-N(6)/adenine(1519)-N(6))-dimethyltransferase RsmA [Reichenbachiella sp.]MDW3209744.1 16S rRNA (adenine(1518)-N(6)/adenine(1519)-N(6))-dimethyltransferase RsmA [Reichenbachiella sp.]
MAGVKPKKHLGQHFLKDQNIADNIVKGLFDVTDPSCVLEVGPGTGVLSDLMVDKGIDQLVLMDLDAESVDYLKNRYIGQKVDIQFTDFLKSDFKEIFGDQPLSIIGNFPYNISSQIFFKVLENRNQVNYVVGMIQKEVADRIVSKEGNKTYGILSVLLQAYYDIEYLFTVPPHVFNPPPKVNSGVIRLVRNNVKQLDCDEKLFIRVVKEGFGKRRKTLRNALKGLNLPESMMEMDVLNMRAEQLSVADFIELTKLIEGHD